MMSCVSSLTTLKFRKQNSFVFNRRPWSHSFNSFNILKLRKVEILLVLIKWGASSKIVSVMVKARFPPLRIIKL